MKWEVAHPWAAMRHLHVFAPVVREARRGPIVLIVLIVQIDQIDQNESTVVTGRVAKTAITATKTSATGPAMRNVLSNKNMLPWPK